ncbi:esterase [Bdellovibrio bacteriovorus]|uniref:Esterase n=1 Tax=Bdellovibrio bacteriovorus TaxID=959 RepID=A0A150WE88_BDEBC|nr:thioesterase family protein [Bdellovibrio bacteriovorus]KYG61306.1 esterase [Bdellovibrio bacteriovorus]KYG65353.1 esterase [Bdellovibrio bacteriovorus]
MFIHRHKVQFYETDLMGIVHHSNYLRFYEEARVGWAHAKGLLDYQKPGSASQFAVYETQVRHIKPTFFGDDLEIEVQGRTEGNRIVLQYRLRGRNKEICSLAKTVHVALGPDLKLQRLSAEMKAAAESDSWTETWL